MDLTFQISFHIALYSIGLYFHHQSHPQLGVFLFWCCLFTLFCVISPLISSSILGPYRPGSSSFSALSFCLFIVFMGLSGQEHESGLPFPSPVQHVLLELSTMTRPSWVALQGIAYSIIELYKTVVHVIRLVSFM